jgi:hypothetical protein
MKARITAVTQFPDWWTVKGQFLLDGTKYGATLTVYRDWNEGTSLDVEDLDTGVGLSLDDGDGNVILSDFIHDYLRGAIDTALAAMDTAKEAAVADLINSGWQDQAKEWESQS